MISQAILEDMRAAAAGLPFRQRSWQERPWRAGERLMVRIRLDEDGSLCDYAATVRSWGHGIFTIVMDEEADILAGNVVDMRPL